MDDKDRMGEAKGTEDALRPLLPGGERVRPGESGSADEASGMLEDPAGRAESPVPRGRSHPDDRKQAED